MFVFFLQVARVGRNVSVINVDLINDATGKVVAQGSHVKFISQSEPDLSHLAAAAATAACNLPSPRNSQGAKL